MTKDELIKALAATDMSLNDISTAINTERAKDIKRKNARNDLIGSFRDYITILIPDVEFSENDINYLKNQFEHLEKEITQAANILRKTKPTVNSSTSTSDKNSIDEDEVDKILKKFLNDFDLF